MDAMTIFTAVGACAAVVAAIVSVVAAKSSRRSDEAAGRTAAAIEKIAATGAPEVALRVDLGATTLSKATSILSLSSGWTGYTLRNLGTKVVKIVDMKTGRSKHASNLPDLPATIEPAGGYSFSLIQDSMIWGTSHTITVTIEGSEEPVYVSVP